MPKELNHSKKGFINTQNTDNNKYFKFCLVRYLNPAEKNPARTKKTNKEISKTTFNKDIDILLIKVKEQFHYILIKDYNTSM